MCGGGCGRQQVGSQVRCVCAFSCLCGCACVCVLFEKPTSLISKSDLSFVFVLFSTEGKGFFGHSKGQIYHNLISLLSVREVYEKV